MIEIRFEKPTDFEEVFRVNELAFGRKNEAELVNRLRASAPYISLVAVENDKIVGHIFFSPLTFAPKNEKIKAFGLAPMAVLPEFQNQKIGSRIVERGLEECRKSNIEAVFVLGHPKFYPRFGFNKAVVKNFKSEYNVPDEVFMVLEIVPNSLDGLSGTVKYHSAFSEV